ncbi:NAD(P)-binding protein [Vulcanisaeta thermophila]|uniref:NAD(P)-binding protein n=1 Tax=Vulcanisaeta thermophila TaxID=867917 RepID=UPI00085399FB|nr:FAD/NAD(P)-binding protein [Vulcanisaeta thermophila]
MVSYTIIGAGLAGLVLAKELVKSGFGVRVIEYRDYPGGIHTLNEEILRGVMKDVGDVEINYESTAVLINDKPVIVSRKGVEELGGNTIVATGFRVMTPVELGIYGDRPAGVYAFHAVIDLLRSDLLPGRNVVVYGDNVYAWLLTKELINKGVNALMVSPSGLMGVSSEAVRVGRIKYVRGSSRVEKILIDNEWVNADTLVIGMFRPYNPIPRYPAVGQAVLDVYDPNIVMESARIMARELLSMDNDYITITSELPVFPGPRVHRSVRRVIVNYRGKLLINDREVMVNGPTVIELPDVESVRIRRWS